MLKNAVDWAAESYFYFRSSGTLMAVQLCRLCMSKNVSVVVKRLQEQFSKKMCLEGTSFGQFLTDCFCCLTENGSAAVPRLLQALGTGQRNVCSKICKKSHVVFY